MNNACGILLSVALIGAGSAATAAAPPAEMSRPGVKTEHFDRDPGWEGLNNRLMPKVLPTYTQDFGYSKTNFAGQEKGEMGGRVCRVPTPAYYAAKITPRTLNDTLSASGTFAINATAGNTAVFFGWFNAQQPGAWGLAEFYDSRPSEYPKLEAALRWAREHGQAVTEECDRYP